MKKLLLFIVTLVAITSCSNSKQPQRGADGKILKNGQFYDSQEAETKEVWICMGKSSHAYHSTDECYGIKACKGRKKKISLDEAVSMGRTPCHYCHETGTYLDDEECEDCEEEEVDEDEQEEFDPDRDDSGVYIIDGKEYRNY